MYLITAYFDMKTTCRLQKLMDKIAKETGNDFMIRNQVPPHLTISAFEKKEEGDFLKAFEIWAGKQKKQSIELVTCGVLLPYVIYTMPVLSWQMQRLQEDTCTFVSEMEEVRIQRYYRPYSWMPHVTLGKTLDEGEMKNAFAVIQKSFSPIRGEITQLGLARTNPHVDLCRVKCLGDA